MKNNNVEDILLIKYGEIALRGGNRNAFELKLVRAIENNIRPLSYYKVKREKGRIFVYNEDTSAEFDYDAVIPKILPIMGIVGICPAICISNNELSNLQNQALIYMNRYYNTGTTSFKVETKRSNKGYPLKSPEISYEVGGFLLDNSEFLTVDVHNPEVTLNVEIREKVYMYAKIIKGFGGLPVASSGKGMLLLSAGIDSPIAAFLSAKRGIKVEAVYFHSPPYTSERAKEKVFDLCKKLSLYNDGIILHVINFTQIQMFLQEKVPPEKITLLLKRQMFRIGEIIANNIECDILITGDSVGQVASQTLRSIAAIDDSVDMPVLRPLATYDKQEIIKIARKIDTFDISIRPFEDCCTLFVPKHPETKPKTSIIRNIEENILDDLDPLFEEAISNQEIVTFENEIKYI